MNFLDSLVNQAKQKKKQIGNVVQGAENGVRDVFDANTQADQQRRATAGQPRSYQQQQASLGNPSNLYKLGTGIGLGGVRSATGDGQFISGLYDLITPGHGTNRISQSLDRFAKNTDLTAQNEGINPMIYRGGQFGTDALSFAVGAGEAKVAANAAMKAPGVAKAASPLIRGADVLQNATVNPLARLEAKGIGGRVAARTARGAIDPANNAANLLMTAKQTGEQASKGRDISPTELAKNVAVGTAFNVGLPLAGALTHEGALAGGRVMARAPQVTQRAGKAVNTKLTPKQFQISPEDHAALTDYSNMMNSRYLPDQGGYDVATQNILARKAFDISKKTGLDITGGPANVANRVDQYLQDFQKHQDTVLQGGYVGVPSDASDDLVKKVFTKGTDDNALYHGTKYDNAIKILESGKIAANKPNADRKLIHEPGKSQVSLSRQRNSGFYNSPSADVKFVVDKNKIGKTTGYVDGDLKPSDYKTPSIFEAESQTKKDIPLHAIKRIEGGPLLELADEQRLRKLADKNKIPFVAFDDTAAMRKVLPKSGIGSKPSTDRVVNGKAMSVDPEASTPKAKKTGIVDKQLNDAQQAQKHVINYAAEELLNGKNATRDIHSEIRKAGGISKSDYEDIPTVIKNKNGLPMDEMAANLGFNSDAELYDAIHNNKKAMTLKEAKAEATQQLEAGDHPYSQDYKQITDAIKQRQDELSLYPKGTYHQVKVSNKAPRMSDAEFQSLAATPEGSMPKQGNRVVNNDPKTTLRNADAERQVQNVLKKGGNSEEAISTYMSATGADLQTAVRDVRRVAQESNLGFDGGKNPLAGSVPLGGHIKEGDAGQAFLNADFIRQHEQSIGKDALDAFHGLSAHDKTLLQNIEKDTVSNVAKQADNPKAFTDAEKAIRTYYDTRHAYDKKLGIDVGYRQNYLRQLFTKAETEAKAALPDQTDMRAGNKRPGYTQNRSFDTLHTHVGQALERDIQGASFNHAKLAYAKGLQDAFPEQTNNSGQLVRGKDGKAFRQLENKYGEGITAHPDVANGINTRARKPVTNKGLQRYDKVNAGIKYTKLGGGAFHAVTEAGNFIGQQLTSGKLFTNPKASGTALRTFFSPKTMERENVRFRSNGTLQNAQISGLKIMPHEILADANVKLGGKLSKATGIQQLHDATFQREIPYMKLKMFEQKTKGLDPTKPADIAKMRSVAKGVNSLFGGINRDIEGINPQTFQRMQRFVLATDFTESKIGTAVRALKLTDRSPAAKLARQAVIGKVLLFAGLAAAGGALSGEYKDKTPKQIAENILGKFADPSFRSGDYKVALPATHVSELSRPFESLFDSKNKTASTRLSGLQHYATGRLAAVPGAVFQGVTNKDYSGNRIYGKDYKFNGGEQISPGKTAANVAGIFGPIPFSQVSNTVQGKQNVPAAAANVAGLRVTNEKLYNQDATPVKIANGNSSINLTKDKAIAYNKAVADQKTTLDKQLKGTAQYKTASADDQKAMLTKLHGYITKNQQRIAASQNNTPLDKAPSASEKAVNSGKLPTNLAKGATTSSDKSFSDQLATARKNYQDKKSSMSRFDQYKAEDNIKSLEVKQNFTKGVVGLYGSGMSKQDVYDYLTKDPDGTRVAKDLVAYGDALVDAGLTSTNKYRLKDGTVSIRPKAKSSSSGGSKKSITTLINEFKLPYGNEIKNRTKGAQLARSAGLAKKA